jgi:arginine/ornithine N-succinyltransferase beta subunit
MSGNGVKRMMAVAVLAALTAGCAGDTGKQLMSSPEQQARIMDMISANAATAEGMTERLLASDSTRAMVLDKLMGSTGGAQAVLEKVGKDPGLLSGVLTQAAQDPALRQQVLDFAKELAKRK